jgi:hypothetical protein
MKLTNRVRVSLVSSYKNIQSLDIAINPFRSIFLHYSGCRYYLKAQVSSEGTRMQQGKWFWGFDAAPFSLEKHF